MKNTTRKGIGLAVGVLSLGTSFGIAAPTLAAPRDRDVRQERRDVNKARNEVKDERRDMRRANTPAERRNERRDVKEAREDLREERQELKRERRQNGSTDRPGWNRPGYNNNNRPVYNNGNRPIYRPGNGNGYTGRGYVGTVTRVRSSQSFDVNIGGNTFNVYTVSNVPRALSVGDQVRINGVQQYNNDIRNASVSILRNR